MANTIKIKRGLKTNLPTLAVGEMGYCTDTNELFIGTNEGNELINEDTDISQLSNIGDVSITTPAIDQVLVYDGTNWVNEEPAAGGVQIVDSTETITVGLGGNFATINEALADITKKYPVYVSATVRPRVTINLLTGFVMAEQVIVDGLDLSWITISSVDAEVMITRSALTTANDNNRFAAFTSQNGGSTPIINVLFNMDTSGDGTKRDGLNAFNNSRAIILNGKGFKNASSIGILAERNSTINATGVNVSGSNSRGIAAQRNSTIHADNANASGSSAFGIIAEGKSSINATAANASGAGSIGIYALQNSTINARAANGQKDSSPGTSDLRVDSGSIMLVSQATGGTNISINTLTSNGIIFG